MKQTIVFRFGLMLLVALAWVSCNKDDDGPRTVDPQDTVAGQCFEEWIVDWWQFLMSHDCTTFPTAGVEPQSGPVYFLSGPVATYDIEITLRRDQYLLTPLHNYINDYPCPDPNFQPAPGQSLEEFLQEGARQWVDLVDGLTLKLDGENVPVGASQRLLTDLFAFQGNPEIAGCFDPCVTGELQYAASDGYWVMFRPLSAGTHRLEIGSAHPWVSNVHDGRITIHVE